jgi:hypothetical protein
MLLRLQFEDRNGRVVLTGQTYSPNRNRDILDILVIVRVIRGGRTVRVELERVARLPFLVDRRRPIHLQDQWSQSDDEWETESDSDDSDLPDGDDAEHQNGRQNGLGGPADGPCGRCGHQHENGCPPNGGQLNGGL